MIKPEFTLVLDVDGTICPIKKIGEKYEDVVPYNNMVKRLQEEHKKGTKIILYTSRNMNSYAGNIGLINANTAKILLKWLDKWSIPYDEIVYGKPWPGHFGVYVDDRAVRPSEFRKYSIEECIAICDKEKSEKLK